MWIQNLANIVVIPGVVSVVGFGVRGGWAWGGRAKVVIAMRTLTPSWGWSVMVMEGSVVVMVMMVGCLGRS